MSVGDMVMVKNEDEGDSDDPNKTQVILQLQPISTGYVLQPGFLRNLHSRTIDCLKVVNMHKLVMILCSKVKICELSSSVVMSQLKPMQLLWL